MRYDTYPGMTAGAVWQSDAATSYRCPYCGAWIRTQYEGTLQPTVAECRGPLGGHALAWPDADVQAASSSTSAVHDGQPQNTDANGR